MAEAPHTFSYPKVSPVAQQRQEQASKTLTQRELVSASLLRVPPKQ
jgi:hypothetical protein